MPVRKQTGKILWNGEEVSRERGFRDLLERNPTDCLIQGGDGALESSNAPKHGSNKLASIVGSIRFSVASTQIVSIGMKMVRMIWKRE
jgi:hypothetical protein